MSPGVTSCHELVNSRNQQAVQAGLVHDSVEITESKFPVLVLERPELYFRLVSELCDQAEGVPGSFVLSESLDLLDLGKSVHVVTDLFHIDLNGRKQAVALGKHLNSLAVSEKHIQSILKIKSAIHEWAMELEEDLPYPTAHHEDLDIGSVIKVLGIRFDEDMAELGEKLCSLIKICAAYLNIRLLVFVGLHSCLDEFALHELYKTAMYEKMPVLDIESDAPSNRLQCEKYYIIDSDYCEIYNEYDDESL